MTAADLIRTNAIHGVRAAHPFILYEDVRVSGADYYRECCRFANLFARLRRPGAPFHVGVLMDNVPEYLYALGGAALAGAVIVGINNTRRGTHLARDIRHTDCAAILTETRYLPLLEPISGELGPASERIIVSHRWDAPESAGQPEPLASPGPCALGEDLDAALAALPGDPLRDPQVEVGDEALWLLIFTSGTATAPKAVIQTHRRALQAGLGIGAGMALTERDVGYLSMPLFHANGIMCGLMPALCYGAGLALIRKFSKSQWLADVRRYGVTFWGYTGKPLTYILSTPRRPHDHVNRLRIAYGNEGSYAAMQEFEARFGCTLIEVFGATEAGLGVVRQTGDPPGSVGLPGPEIKILDAGGRECPPARFDARGRLLNTDEAVGEVVNTGGLYRFDGYYKNEEATRERTRGGWYWSGDLGYKDERGYLYFAGRTSDWIRVEGENFPARPIEEIVARHPDVVLAAAYGVPDPQAGDQVMVAITLRAGARFEPQGFYDFLAVQPDLAPKWMPALVRVAAELPLTPSQKIVKRELQREKFRRDAVTDPIYWREKREKGFRRLTAEDYRRLEEAFAACGRSHLLDI